MHEIANEIKFLTNVVDQAHEVKQDIKSMLKMLNKLDSKLVKVFKLLGDRLEITGDQLDKYEKDFVKEYEAKIMTNEELKRTEKFGDAIKKIIGI
jgi:hypothetical protein